MSKLKTGMGFSADDGDEKPPDKPDRPRQDSRPICPEHQTQMVAYASNAMFTYYECKTANCSQRAKRVRPIGPLKNKYGNG